MQELGLYLHDLNLFDGSRDMVMAGENHASTLEYSIEKVCTGLPAACVLALLDFLSRVTYVAQASVCPSINSGFSETAAWMQAKFHG